MNNDIEHIFNPIDDAVIDSKYNKKLLKSLMVTANKLKTEIESSDSALCISIYDLNGNQNHDISYSVMRNLSYLLSLWNFKILIIENDDEKKDEVADFNFIKLSKRIAQHNHKVDIISDANIHKNYHYYNRAINEVDFYYDVIFYNTHKGIPSLASRNILLIQQDVSFVNEVNKFLTKLIYKNIKNIGILLYK